MPIETSQVQNRDDNLSLNEKMRDLGKLVDKVKVGMLTTHRTDGHLVSRPMHVAKRDSADLYLVTNNQSHKVDEIKHDDHVNMAFYDHETREWASISGTNEILQDQGLVGELYNEDLRAWFGDLGDGKHDGGPKDPRISILKVRAHSLVCSIQDRSMEQAAKDIHEAARKGNMAKVSSIREIAPEELEKVRQH